MEWLRHFDPNPQWYLWTLHVITAISFPIFLIGMSCILCVNITANGSTYKYLLAINLTMTYLTQLSLSAGTIPVLALPFPGGYPLGFLQKLGIPSCIQFVIVIYLITVNGLTTVILFFYRSHVAIPFNRTFFYGSICLFIFLAACLPPVWLGVLCKVMNTDRTAFEKECPDIVAQIPKDIINGSFLIMEITPYLVVCLNYFVFLSSLGIILIIAFTYRATVLLRKQIFSTAALALHKTLVKSLIIQTTVYYSFFFTPIGFMMVIASFHIALPTAANLALIVLALSDPAGVLALIFAHKKYRRAVLRPFCKDIDAVNPVIYVSTPRRGSSAPQLQIDPNPSPLPSRSPSRHLDRRGSFLSPGNNVEVSICSQY